MAANRWFKFVLGLIFSALGIAGALLPLLPSTVFFICAAYFFSQSSAKLESWILNHPRFGEPVRAWKVHRAMPKNAKILSAFGMLISFTIILSTSTSMTFISSAGAIFVLSSAYIWTRPNLMKSS